MFRRSLVAFLTVSFAVLALVLGYALIGLSGPESTLQEARQAMANKRPLRALQLAERAWEALGPNADPELRIKILQTRRMAHESTSNAQLVLIDIQEQRRLQPDREDLARDELRWTLAAGNAEIGYSRAEALVAESPDDPILIELAGEAAQLLYQKQIGALIDEVRGQLPVNLQQGAFAALRSWLFSPKGSLAADASRRRFEAMLQDRATTTYVNREWQATALSVSRLIQEAQTYYRRALESGGTPVAAYRGLAYALREAGRMDDLEWHAEAYLRRYDHAYTTDAAKDLAQLHFLAGRNRAVIATVERFFGDEDPVERALSVGFSENLSDLLLVSARARFLLNDAEGLTRDLRLCDRLITEAGIDLGPSYHWILALEAYANDRRREVGQALAEAYRGYAAMPKVGKTRDRMIAVAEMRLQIAVEYRWSAEAVDNFTRLLTVLSPDDPRPLIENGIRHMGENDLAGALQQFVQARRLKSTDERVKRLMADLRNERSLASGLGGAEQVYRSAVELGSAPPSTAVEILPLAAEIALERREFEVAKALADQAASSDPTWLWPREIATRADILLGEPEQASRRIQEVLAVRADDEEALEMLRSLRRTAGLPIDDLVRDLLVAGQTDSAVAERMLQFAIARDDGDLAQHLARALAGREEDDARAYLMLGRVERDAGNPEVAKPLFNRALELAISNDTTALQEALVELVLTSAELGESQEVLRQYLETCLPANYENTEVHVRLAEQLLEFDQPILAFLAIQPVLTSRVHEASRTGEHFLLGGRIALRNGNLAGAEDLYLKALSFPESDVAAQRELALMRWAERSPDDAIRTWSDHRITDLSSAAHAAKLVRRARAAAAGTRTRLPDTIARKEDLAIQWLRNHRSTEPLDPGAVALQALMAEVELGAPGSPAVLLARSHPEELLEALLFLDAPNFSREAVLRTRDLLEASTPDEADLIAVRAHWFARLLHGRALTNYGQHRIARVQLLELLKDVPLMVEAYEEILRSLEIGDPAPQLDAEVLRLLNRPEVAGTGIATPRVSQLLARQISVGLVLTQGIDQDTITNLAEQWIRNPERTNASLTEVRLLITAGQSAKALLLCKRLEQILPDDQRADFLEFLFLLYDYEIKRAGRDGRDTDLRKLRDEAIDEARIRHRNFGALGVIINFEIDQMVREFGPVGSWVDPKIRRAARQILDDHLAYLRDGGADDSRFIVRTLDFLADLDGRGEALLRCDQLLKRDPSRVELWMARARWLIDENRQAEAVKSLRWIYDLLPTHPVVLDVIELVIRNGELSEREASILRNLDDAVRESPAGRFVRGLFELRNGDPALAESLIADSRARSDGAHLYYRGLAMLRSGRVASARELLEELAESYPRSSLSLNAAHFAARLVE